ncbi:MAG TPA: FUSC family protein [Stellaceae bacterium]|nr:FUSC family protein [Stellaceae bacterium]
MTELGLPADRSPNTALDRMSLALRAAGPPLLFGVRLWASVCLSLYIAFWLQLENAFWAGTTAAIVCQPSLGASLRKGWFRMIGTVVGAVVIVALTACFPQDRASFLLCLAAWGALCASAATLLRNFAAYSAALAGYTAAIIATDQLGAVGGLNGEAFTLAVSRVSEIGIGIVCAGIVLAATGTGNAPRRLAGLLAGLVTDIATGFAATLRSTGASFAEMQATRRAVLQRAIALDPAIDEVLGESYQLRPQSRALQRAADGLVTALAGWRAVAVGLARLPPDPASREAATLLRQLPAELGPAAPARMRTLARLATRRLLSLPAKTPAARLLAVQAAEVMGGLTQAMNGLALLAGEPAVAGRTRSAPWLGIADWLPAAINGLRAFLMIGLTELFWVVTGWTNGAAAITWVAVTVILFAPRADQAYATSFRFAVGNGLAAVLTAIFAFAVLPRFEGFAGLSAAMGLYLVPMGALMTQSWLPAMFTAMTANFVPLLAPQNPMVYDTAQYYNGALAIILGSSLAAFSFRLLPPPSPALRTRRLLWFTLRDLRDLALGRRATTVDGWRGLVNCRLAAMPEEATPLQRAQLLAGLSVGTGIVRLGPIARRLGFDGDLDAALSRLAAGDSEAAIAALARLDDGLALRRERMRAALRARGILLAIAEALAQHRDYFDGEVAR